MQALLRVFAGPLRPGSLLPLAIRNGAGSILGAREGPANYRASPRCECTLSISLPLICGSYPRDQVLLSSGAHLSRYLVQVAVHHYFRSLCPFIKTPWVRTLSLSTFGHFLKQSSKRFGAINIAKGEDDGAVFRNFIKDSRRHADRRGLATDAIEEMLEKGKVSLFEGSEVCLLNHSSQFIPFCSKVRASDLAESQYIHDDYRTQSWPSFPWRFPSYLAFSRWLLQMGSVWIVECAYTASRRHRSKCSTRKRLVSTAILCSAEFS